MWVWGACADSQLGSPCSYEAWGRCGTNCSTVAPQMAPESTTSSQSVTHTWVQTRLGVYRRQADLNSKVPDPLACMSEHMGSVLSVWRQVGSVTICFGKSGVRVWRGATWGPAQKWVGG